MELAGGSSVVSTAKVSLTKEVERVDEVDSNVVLFQHAQVLNLVSLEVGLDLRVFKGLRDSSEVALIGSNASIKISPAVIKR